MLSFNFFNEAKQQEKVFSSQEVQEITKYLWSFFKKFDFSFCLNAELSKNDICHYFKSEDPRFTKYINDYLENKNVETFKFMDIIDGYLSGTFAISFNNVTEIQKNFRYLFQENSGSFVAEPVRVFWKPNGALLIHSNTLDAQYTSILDAEDCKEKTLNFYTLLKKKKLIESTKLNQSFNSFLKKIYCVSKFSFQKAKFSSFDLYYEFLKNSNCYEFFSIQDLSASKFLEALYIFNFIKESFLSKSISIIKNKEVKKIEKSINILYQFFYFFDVEIIYNTPLYQYEIKEYFLTQNSTEFKIFVDDFLLRNDSSLYTFNFLIRKYFSQSFFILGTESNSTLLELGREFKLSSRISKLFCENSVFMDGLFSTMYSFLKKENFFEVRGYLIICLEEILILLNFIISIFPRMTFLISMPDFFQQPWLKVAECCKASVLYLLSQAFPDIEKRALIRAYQGFFKPIINTDLKSKIEENSMTIELPYST